MTESRKARATTMTVRTWSLMLLLMLLSAVNNADATTSLTVLSNMPIVERWWGTSPDGEIVYTAAEASHIKSIVAVVGVFTAQSAPTLSPDVGPNTSSAIAQQITYFVVPSGKPCRDPVAGTPNGTAVFAAGQFIDANGTLGAVQAPKLASVTVPMPANSSLCAIALGDFSVLQGTATINIGP